VESRCSAVLGELDVVALEPEGALEGDPDGRFVVDDEDAHARSVAWEPVGPLRTA
jgi:hypothetical protein